MSANAFSNPTLIAKESLRRLENNMVMAGLINRQYDPQFNGTGTKPGVTINIRKPARYIGREGQAAQVEGITDPLTSLTIDTQFGVDLGYSSQEEALNLESYSEQVIEPATARIAQYMDSALMQAGYREVANHVGTPGVTPNSIDTYIDAGVKLNDNAVPQGRLRRCVLNPTQEGSLIKGEKSRFSPATDISEMLRAGRMGHAVGFDFYMSQSVKSHTIGALGGTPLVNGASQTGASLITDGWTASAATRLKRGDIFTIADVYAVNPETRESTGQLQQFVVTADGASDGSGNMTISIFPEITLAGAYQTVTVLPANNAALTIYGAASTATPQALAFHRDFMTLAMVDLYIPKGVDMAGRANSKKRNISIRFVRFWDGMNDRLVTRLDVLFGIKVLRPEMACRISG
jgi:hypothetical protein